nr:hypothetical protein CFP56_77199 [Quercus suber]
MRDERSEKRDPGVNASGPEPSVKRSQSETVHRVALRNITNDHGQAFSPAPYVMLVYDRMRGFIDPGALSRSRE